MDEFDRVSFIFLRRFELGQIGRKPSGRKLHDMGSPRVKLMFDFFSIFKSQKASKSRLQIGISCSFTELVWFGLLFINY